MHNDTASLESTDGVTTKLMQCGVCRLRDAANIHFRPRLCLSSGHPRTFSNNGPGLCFFHMSDWFP